VPVKDRLAERSKKEDFCRASKTPQAKRVAACEVKSELRRSEATRGVSMGVAQADHRRNAVGCFGTRRQSSSPTLAIFLALPLNLLDALGIATRKSTVSEG
jgi:hypothetical protein